MAPPSSVATQMATSVCGPLAGPSKMRHRRLEEGFLSQVLLFYQRVYCCGGGSYGSPSGNPQDVWEFNLEEVMNMPLSKDIASITFSPWPVFRQCLRETNPIFSTPKLPETVTMSVTVTATVTGCQTGHQPAEQRAPVLGPLPSCQLAASSCPCSSLPPSTRRLWSLWPGSRCRPPWHLPPNHGSQCPSA